MSGAFGWGAIARLGLVQACIGAVVVMATSTMNRVMVVEHGLPALLPGLLVASHYLVQVARPRMGHGSDLGQRRTPWILGGMVTLALGGLLGAAATAWMGQAPWPGIGLAIASYLLLGVGVSAAGTSLLALLARRVAAPRHAAAATTVWLMMIAGFALTSAVAGRLLDPYSGPRLVSVAGAVSLLACVLTWLAMHRLEGQERGTGPGPATAATPASVASFRQALREVWSEPAARRFTQFVFLSMLAYSAQELLMEPFAGVVLAYTPGQSAGLSGLQHGGVLAGMLVAALAGRGVQGRRFGSLRAWQVAGCLGSALMLVGLAGAAALGSAWPLRANVAALGVANGVFSIAAVASMMQLAGAGQRARAGLRMGLWGAAQAVAFGVGGLVGTGGSDLARRLIGTPAAAYAAVFAFEAALFIAAAGLAGPLGRAAPDAGRCDTDGRSGDRARLALQSR